MTPLKGQSGGAGVSTVTHSPHYHALGEDGCPARFRDATKMYLGQSGIIKTVIHDTLGYMSRIDGIRIHELIHFQGGMS